MPDSITARSLGRGFAEIEEEFVLEETQRTKLIFKAQVHAGGIRGRIIRCRKNNNGSWEEDTPLNFNRLQPGEGVNIELNTEATRKLDDAFNKLITLLQQQGIRYGRHSYVTAEADSLVITDRNKARIIQQLLEKGYTEDFWQLLVEENPDLAARLASSQIQIEKQAIISEFKESLRTKSSNENYWQEFFEKNPWILQQAFSAPVFMLRGETYLGGKRPVGRQGEGGVATDFLFSDDSTKSFAVIDIKTPSTSLMAGVYRGSGGSNLPNEVYSASTDLSGGVIQVKNQVAVAVENFESVLGPGFHHKINRVHPRGILIIGQYSGLAERQKDSFNHFRYSLHSLTVITYDELLHRLELIFEQPGA